MIGRTKKNILIVGFACLILQLPKAGVSQTVLYDDFKSQKIDPSKWVGGQNYDPDIREASRSISGYGEARRLRITQTAYSSTSDDMGGSGGVFGLDFPSPGAITEVAFSVAVNDAKAVACDTNDSLDVTDAEFRGSFFNTEISPTSQIGNVIAVIDVARDATDRGRRLSVDAFYSRCDDQYCAAQTPLFAQVLGTVLPGAVSRLRIKWDQPNHQFIFQLNDEAEVAAPYVVSDASLPFEPFKAIELARVVPHCTAARRPFTKMEASFRDVYVNSQ